MDDLLSEFLTETAESLAVIDVELVKFEQDPNDTAILSNIFRLVHTIKGTCGFLGLPRLEAVAHAGENVLGKFRDGELDVTPEAVSLILSCIDTIRGLLGDLEETGQEPAGDDTELIGKLNAMADGKAPADAAPSPEPEASPLAEAGPVESDDGFPIAAELLAEVAEAESHGARAATDEEMAADMAAETAPDQAAPAPVPDSPAAPAAPAPAKLPATRGNEPPGESKGAKEPGVTSQTIRVNVELLESLMTLVSELVLTRNQLLQMVRGRDDSEFVVPLQRLSHITSDLQEGVMKTRMQPIGNAWAKLPRIVRDLCVETGKKIELHMLGAETELDRQVLELIKDPLTHMVRNSADHGIESAAERTAAGKAELGTIILNAYHEGGHIIIEIKDDGKGLNTDRIRQKILANGLASDAELEAMTDAQIHQHIFKAGFSTAEQVTSVSGRGVGMDVVRTNIEKIGGTIELKSIAGRGSTFTIKIPLTLAIVSALIVEVGGLRFAIPQISVLELVRASTSSENGIEMINDSPVLRLRDRLLPLVHMQQLLDLRNGTTNGVDEVEDRAAEVEGHPEEAKDHLEEADDHLEEAEDHHVPDELFVVVAQVGTYTFGIIVDRVFDTEEIVVKPVAPILRDVSYYSGNTILGDGSVIMILDPNGIAGVTGHGASDGADMAATSTNHEEERTSLLVFRAGQEELKAVPLSLVARLEEVDLDKVEVSNGRHVVQYRGHLMPLIPFDARHQWPTEGQQPVLVFSDGRRSMGMVVDEIIDIVEERLNIEMVGETPGVVGSAVVNGKATDVVDAGYYLTQAYPDWFGSQDDGPHGADDGAKRILLVDDSPFFRGLIAPLLQASGYAVTTAGDPTSALRMRDQGLTFDAIISDIEMPEMDGFTFAEAVRKDERWSSTPILALSSHATDQDFERGRAVGFTDYLAKFDRDSLIHVLAQTLSSGG